MKIEQTIETFCRVIDKKARVHIRVHLAERLCGYDLGAQRLIVFEQENNSAGQHYEFIKQEEEKSR